MREYVQAICSNKTPESTTNRLEQKQCTDCTRYRPQRKAKWLIANARAAVQNLVKQTQRRLEQVGYVQQMTSHTNYIKHRAKE